MRLAVVIGLVSVFGACVQPPPHAAPSTPATALPAAADNGCSRAEVALQVLGSGGPIPDDDRASSGYLVWHRGKSRALIDVGGGTFVRFGAAGARIDELDVIAISHLHADHVADLPALLKGGYFANRTRALPLVGPSGNERFPSMEEHVRALFDPAAGAFRYLSGYLDGDGLFPLALAVVDHERRTRQVVFDSDGLKVEAIGVHHGVIPALGFLLTVGDKRIAFGGDQSADNAAFASMIHGADLLVAHHALPESGADDVRHLHRTPSEIGALALDASVGSLVLSHNMARALDDLDAGLEAIASKYKGPVDVARDSSCYPLAP